MSDLKMKSDQFEAELRKGVDKDLRLQRFERHGVASYADEIAQLKEKCEEMAESLRMVNDEKEAAQFLHQNEIRLSGAYVDCNEAVHDHETHTKHFKKLNASSRS